MADAILASQNAALTSALLQSHQQNQAALVPALLATRILKGQDTTAWFGGSHKLEDARYRP